MTGSPHLPGHPDDLLSGLLDQELSTAEAQSVEAHLQGCPTCRAALAAEQDVRQALRNLDVVPAPAGFVPSVVWQRRRANRRGVALSLAAALVAVVGSIAWADMPERSSGSRLEDLADRVDGGADDPDLTRLEADDDGDGGDEGADREPPDRSLIDRSEDAAQDLLGLFSP